MGFLAVLLAVAAGYGLVWARAGLGVPVEAALGGLAVGALLVAFLARSSGRWALMIAVIAAASLGAGAAGIRTGVIPLPVALGFLIGGGAVIAIQAALAGIAALLTGGEKLSALVAIVLAAGLAYFPVAGFLAARDAPQIHDISTDTDNPPEFVAIAPLRAGAANPAEYAGPEAAAAQKKGYPDLKPVVMGFPAAEAFARALKTAKSFPDWQIVEANEAEGRIEATATTRLLGFKDDIVIRVTADPADPAKCTLDIRSKSRVGRSDLGANARRIREFIARLTYPA